MSSTSEPSLLADFPPLLTVEEARQVLRVGRNQLYEAIQRGEVPAIRLGNTIRIPRHRLEEFLHAA